MFDFYPEESKAMVTARTIHLATGSTITVRRRGLEVDLETRDAVGNTVSTVVMGEADAIELLRGLDKAVYA